MTTKTTVFGAVALGVGAVVTAASVALLRVVVGRVVLPGTQRWIDVMATDTGSITLPLTDETRHPGEFGLWHAAATDEPGAHRVPDPSRGHTVVGAVLDTDEDSGTVRRAVLRTTGPAPHRVRWTGHVYAGPASIGAEWSEVDVPTPVGAAPAWIVRPDAGADPHAATDTADTADTDTATWAVHVHGIRTTRVTAIRSVPAALDAGWTSIVPSFRGDGEAPSDARASHLGAREWPDVEAALEAAVAAGARRLVLVGWSMGASITRQLLRHSVHRARIVGVVLVSPALDWATTVGGAAERAGMPGVVVDAALRAMATPGLCRVVGLRSPVDVRDLSWLGDPRPLPPVLLVHSPGDSTVPFHLSEQLAADHPGTVTLAVSATAGHGWERNRDAAWFDEQVLGWAQANGLTTAH
jgi:dienelactone hydrolase